jgi:hypothetical protein
MVVSTRAASMQGRLLATLPNATRVQDIAMPGDEPLAIYRLNGPPPLLPDERALPSVTWQSGDGSALRLVAGARTASGVIRLRWVVEQWTIPHDVNSADMSATPWFELQVRTAAQGGQDSAPTSAPVARATCQPTQLQPGETLFTWISTAWSANGTSLTAVAPPLPTTPLALSVLHGTQALWQKQIGPLRVLSAAPSGIPLAPMTITSTTGANGSYPLPTTLTGSDAP